MIFYKELLFSFLALKKRRGVKWLSKILPPGGPIHGYESISGLSVVNTYKSSSVRSELSLVKDSSRSVICCMRLASCEGAGW